VPQPIFEYYADVVADTFGGDIARARERARLFMMPGMYHCRGGPGPDEFDPLTPLVTWVEQGRAPEYLVARHRSNGAVDNERRVCAEPQHALFTGPAGTANDPGSWVESNFSCR
jgi:feruloyl esterase